MEQYFYLECTVKIGDKEEQDKVTFISSDDIPTYGSLNPDPILVFTIKRFRDYWIKDHHATCGRDDFKILGWNLYRLLFPPESETELAFTTMCSSFFKKKDSNKKLRLRLKLEFTQFAAEEIVNFPWEFLHVSLSPATEFFLAGQQTELILTRSVPPVGEGKPPGNPPIKILLVTSMPHSLPQQSINEIVMYINQLGKQADPELSKAWMALDPSALDQAPAEHIAGELEAAWKKDEPGTRFLVWNLTNPTFQQLGKAVVLFKPHVFHFMGHGEPNRLAFMRRANEITNEGGVFKDADFKEGKDIRQLFEKHRPDLVFLHACNGATPAVTGAKSIARELVDQAVPAVIAMQYDFENADANAFAAEFYRQLSKGMQIDEAVSQGRAVLGQKQVANGGTWASRGFGTPVVFLQRGMAIVIPEVADCPKCGTKNEPDVNNCSNCGSSLKVKLNCSSCGSGLSQTDKFCPNCGTRILVAPATATAESMPQSSTRGTSATNEQATGTLSALDLPLSNLSTNNSNPLQTQAANTGT